MSLDYDVDRAVDSFSEKPVADEVFLSHEVSREEMRKQIACEVKKFLKCGGSITQVEPHVMADPPTKPISGYGKGAI